MAKNYFTIVAVILTIVGALNWGLVGIAKFDLVAYIFGELSSLTRIVYGLVGVAGLYLLIIIKKLIS